MSLPRRLAQSFILALALLPVFVVAQEVTSPTEGQFHPLHLQFEGAAPAAPVLPANSNLRRTSAADSRLTCDDYSKSYFSRHPAMAQVCGVNVHEDTSPTQPAVSSTAPDHL